jgi:hypothetical protein
MDCEPFEADDGPSDDDTVVEQEQQQDKLLIAKNKQKEKTMPCHGQEECTHSPHNETWLSVDGK